MYKKDHGMYDYLEGKKVYVVLKSKNVCYGFIERNDFNGKLVFDNDYGQFYIYDNDQIITINEITTRMVCLYCNGNDPNCYECDGIGYWVE